MKPFLINLNQDEIQARFQGQIVELQSELEMKNKMIDSLQKQLEAIRADAAERPHTPPLPPPQTQLRIEDSSLVRRSVDDSVDEDDNDSVAQYFARSASGGSFVYRSPTSPFDCPSVDAMLFDFTTEEEAAAGPSEQQVLNPQPLWQLEFGSAWERIQKNVIRHNQSPKTSNPRDLVIDFGDSSSNSETQTETDDDDDNVFHSSVVVPTSSRNPFRKSFTVIII